MTRPLTQDQRRSVACPVCGAGPMWPCETHGGESKREHPARIGLARAKVQRAAELLALENWPALE